MADTLCLTSVSRYLIVEPEVVISEDITQTIREFDPKAEIVLAASVELAENILPSLDLPLIAIVDCDVQRFRSSNLSRALVEGGCRVILTGADVASAPDARWHPLPMPFNADALRAALTYLR